MPSELRGIRLWPSLHVLYANPQNYMAYLETGICGQAQRKFLETYPLPFTKDVWEALQMDMTAMLTSAPWACAKCYSFLDFVRQEGVYADEEAARKDYCTLALTEYDPYKRRLRQEGDFCIIGGLPFLYRACSCGFRLQLPTLLNVLFGYQVQERCALLKEELLQKAPLSRWHHLHVQKQPTVESSL